LAKQFCGSVHGKETALLPCLHPDVKGAHNRRLPRIAYGPYADARGGADPGLNQRPYHFNALHYVFRKLERAAVFRDAVYAYGLSVRDNVNVMFHDKMYFSAKLHQPGPLLQILARLANFWKSQKKYLPKVTTHKKQPSHFGTAAFNL
jgi:hypothetical protein